MAFSPSVCLPPSKPPRACLPLRLGLAERPHRRAREAAALWRDSGADLLALGLWFDYGYLWLGGSVACHVHPHQRHDADERSRYGAFGQPGWCI